jgi:hypothetical protein
VNDAEHREQVRLFAWARKEEGARPELGLLFAVPNGGRRDAATGARMKAEGVKRGVPDVWLPVAREGYHGLVIELKADATGRPTPEQVVWLRRLAMEGYKALLCVGADEARSVIVAYLEGRLGGEDG